jgi:hypothetical protein
MNIMAVASGEVVETTHFGVSSGTYYKLGAESPSGRRFAWKRFRQGGIMLHPSLEVRVVDPSEEGIELFF